MTRPVDSPATDRAAAAQRAATTLPTRSLLANARAELFARTFAVWRLRADQAGAADAALPTPAPDAGADARTADAERTDAAKADDAHRAWREMITQAAGGQAPDVGAAFETVAAAPRTDARPRSLRDAARVDAGPSATRATRRRDDVAPSDPSRATADTGALDPALKDKLDRVMARMEQAGHTVTITETVRSQARQDALFAQGRTAPGPVVTWTRNSRHLDGLAVDVQVDGSYDNPAAYELLGKIAQEEGLVTLGPRDPGHLELRADEAVSQLGRMARITEATVTVDAGSSRSARVAEVAQVAQVARVAAPAPVAPVAEVARVATVAMPGVATAAPAHAAAPHAPTANANAPVNAAALTASANQANNADPLAQLPVAVPVTSAGILAAASAGANGASENGTGAGFGNRNGRGVESLARTVAAGAGARGGAPMSAAAATLAGAMGAMPGSTGGATGGGVAGVVGSASALRADEIQSLLEARDRQPISRMTLTLDNEMGGTDHIRVDVRGARVGAALTFGESAQATDAANRINELARALEGRGLATEGLRVANAIAAPDSARSGAAPDGRGAGRQDAQAGNERQPQDFTRQRSRREQGGRQ
jgi:hypothetical protein